MATKVNSNRTPQARLDHTRFVTFGELDLSELLAFGVLVILMPLLSLSVKLPLPMFLLTLVSFPAWAFLLYFVKHQDRNAAYWITKMVPYWLRQHDFRRSSAGPTVTPWLERADSMISTGLNSLSYEWRSGADGIAELHVYEEPLRPYRAWIARAGRSMDHPAVEVR